MTAYDHRWYPPAAYEVPTGDEKGAKKGTLKVSRAHGYLARHE